MDCPNCISKPAKEYWTPPFTCPHCEGKRRVSLVKYLSIKLRKFPEYF